MKSVTVRPGNAARGVPTVQGALVLFDDADGRVEAVIDSALVTKLLILGAGAVAESLAAAYRAVCPGIAVTIWNRTRAGGGAGGAGRRGGRR